MPKDHQSSLVDYNKKLDSAAQQLKTVIDEIEGYITAINAEDPETFHTEIGGDMYVNSIEGLFKRVKKTYRRHNNITDI